MRVLIAEYNISQARKGSERMLEEIVGSRERKTKTEKYSPFRIRGLGKFSEAWSNPLLGCTGRLICKNKAKMGIYQQEEIFLL